MLEKNLLKTQGLSFGRSVQAALKTVILYSVDHPAAERLVEQSYACLVALLKQSEQFTFGFVNNRVLLNKVSTEDNSLDQLKAEFAKRSIAAVSFNPRITSRDFKRILAILATKPKAIEEKGGIQPFLEQNPVEGARIVPAKKRENGDTELEMDPEAFRLAQEILGVKPGSSRSALDLLLQPAGLSTLQSFSGGAGEMLALLGKATQTVLLEPETDARSLVADLARVLQSLAPESLLSCLPPSKQAELRGLSAEEVARDLVEDAAVSSAVNHLANPPAGRTAAAVEEDALQVLLRGLKATCVAERILQKLTQFIAEANLPPEVYDRIRQGLAWYGLSPKERHEQLMLLERFGQMEFQRLLDHAKEMLKEGKVNEAIQVSEHYFAFLDSGDAQRQKDELARAPNLLLAIASPQTSEFLRGVAERLGKELLDEKHVDEERHRQIAFCLNSMAQLFVHDGDFESIHRIGWSLQHSWARNPREHAACCRKALEQLLAPEVVEQLVGVYVEKREDPAYARTVASLLKLIGPIGAEKVLRRLEEETLAANRMRLIGLFIRSGASGVELARKALADERWYVVRNACHLLGELGDPDLPRQLSGALRHPDVRVQQAAVTAILKCHAPHRTRVLAESLPHLHAQMLEATLDELAFLKDPSGIEGLEQFIFLKKDAKAGVLEKAVAALSAIPAERAAQALGKVLADSGQPTFLRKAALDALSHSSCPLARRSLAEFANTASDDPLAAECQRTLAGSSSSNEPR